MAELLVEIGTEELPPKSLASLGRAFAEHLRTGLVTAGLADDDSRPKAFWSPRRLAVRISEVRERQPDRRETRKGPALKAAYDADGKPTKAAEGFARSSGVDVTALEKLETADGAWVVVEREIRGVLAAELLPGLVSDALDALPIARRMRWGAGDAEFVRPVHWVVMLLDDQVVDGAVLGIIADRYTYGHRFHAPQPIALESATDYPARLEAEGMVRVNADDRRLDKVIVELVTQAAMRAGGKADLDAALVAEVASLVEWPVPITGAFDARFLALPPEVIVSVLQQHQRYFPVRNADGALLPSFVAIANLDSRDASVVRRGNERVILPRLADAEFFFGKDREASLESRRVALEGVAFQAKLGSLADKSARVASLARKLAPAFGAEPTVAGRAAELAKCDLVTLMVGEFPELQGTMGRHYALADGEPAAVATAIEEQYLPRYSGDAVPVTPAGRALAVADRLDSLAALFAVGGRPTGDKDPFALRRAAFGVLRILLDAEPELALAEAIEHAIGELRDELKPRGLAQELADFLSDRLRALLADQGVAVDVFEAVAAVAPRNPADFLARAQAVIAFGELPEADALAAANKRIANLLKQASAGEADAAVDDSLLAEAAEQELWHAVIERDELVRPLLASGDYTGALRTLAALREPVDAFFDAVMVMADDAAVRANRIALLGRVHALFGGVADIGRLQRAG